jgi:hypothetical protein
MASSSSEGDEAHRAAAVVEILCKKGIIESTEQGKLTVQSRFGASLCLELVATAIRWRRLNSHQRLRPREPGNDPQTNKDLDASPTVARGSGQEESATEVLTSGSDPSRLTLPDQQGNINLFPFSIEDWPNYMDFSQADLGPLSYDGSW